MDVLLIFLKQPLPGQVKTRLARTLGHEEAVRIYRFLIEKTRQAASAAPTTHRWLFYANGLPEDADGWDDTCFTRYVQCSGDLGERMADAFRRAFAAGASRAVIIGSDCPELSGEHLAEAFGALSNGDVVLGPTPDGGYYLLGLRHFHEALFKGIAWSTPAVFEQTLAVVQHLGWRVEILPPLADIDTEADWKAYLARC